jgi:hypothetical protein
MTQFVRKFGNVTINAVPLDFIDAGWHAFDANDYFRVEALTGAFEGQAYHYNKNVTTYRLGAEYTPAGSSVTDCEVLVRLKISSATATNMGGLVLRGGGSESSENGILVFISQGDLDVGAYTAGTYHELETDGTQNYAQSSWIWIRARVIGSGTSKVISAKSWEATESEPDAWTFTHTDTSDYGPDSGWVGLRGGSEDFSCDFFSFTDSPSTESAPYRIQPFVENFGRMATSVAPTNFTPQWVTTGHTFLVATAATGILQQSAIFDITTNARHAHRYDSVGTDFVNGEVLIRVKVAGNSGSIYHAGIVLRGSGTSSTEDGYVIMLNDANLVITEFNAGSYNQLAAQTGGSITVGNYYWIRARIEDTYLYGKIWADGSAEPGTWTVSHDDTTGTRTSGWIGIFDHSQDTAFDFFSVGLGDDPAPMVVEQNFVDATNSIAEFTETLGGASFSTSIDTSFQTLQASDMFPLDGTQNILDFNSGASDTHQFFSWDLLPPGEDDIEILMRTQNTTTFQNYSTMIMLRVSGTEGVSETYYASTLHNGSVGLFRYDSGTRTLIDRETGYISNYQFYWQRFRINGTSLKWKYWKDGYAEPAEWTVEETDANISTGALGHGIGTYDWADFFVDYIAAGIGGSSPELPEEVIDQTTQLGQNMAGVSTYSSTGYYTVNSCRAEPMLLAYETEIVAVTFACYETTAWPTGGDFRLALYANMSTTDLSNAVLIEDLGYRTTGWWGSGNENIVPLTTKRKFAPGTVIWFVFKSNNNDFNLCAHTNRKNCGSLSPSGYIIYSTEFGSDETVSFPTTTGTLTADSTSTAYTYNFSVIGGKRHKAERYYDFSDYGYEAELDDWEKTMDTHSAFDYTNKEAGYVLLEQTTISTYMTSIVPYYHKVKSHDGDCMALVKITAGQATVGTCMDGSSSGNDKGFVFTLDYTNQYIKLQRWSNGMTTLGTDVAYTLALDTYYWVRIRVDPLRVRAKIWTGEVYDEPLTWNRDETVTTASTWWGRNGAGLYEPYSEMQLFALSGAYNQEITPFSWQWGDEFTGTTGEPLDTSKWTVTDDTYAEIDIYNNQLRAHSTGLGGAGETGTAVWDAAIEDDFTVILDFDIQAYRDQDDAQISLFVFDNNSFSTGNGAYFGVTRLSSADKWRYRVMTSGSWGATDTSTARSNDTGKIRIRRSGTTVKFDYKDGAAGAWTNKDSITLTGDVYIQLYYYMPYPQSADQYDYRIDDFRIYDYDVVEAFTLAGGGGESGYRPAIILVC